MSWEHLILGENQIQSDRNGLASHASLLLIGFLKSRSRATHPTFISSWHINNVLAIPEMACTPQMLCTAHKAGQNIPQPFVGVQELLSVVPILIFCLTEAAVQDEMNSSPGRSEHQLLCGDIGSSPTRPPARPQVFNNTPDETAFYRLWLERETTGSALTMVQPALMSFALGEAPAPVALDVTSIQARCPLRHPAAPPADRSGETKATPVPCRVSCRPQQSNRSEASACWLADEIKSYGVKTGPAGG